MFPETHTQKIKCLQSFAVILGFIVLTGCATNQKLSYKMDDIQPQQDSKLKNYVLDIQKFSDARESIEENRILFSQPRQIKLDETSSCINSEEHYEKGTVTTQLATTISEHLSKKGIFKSVTADKKETADFYVTGTIRRIFSRQEFSTTSAVGAQFGLIGALLTMNATTPGTIEIEFSDIEILDKHRRSVGKIDNLKESFREEFPADAYCWSAYWNLNNKLKGVVDQLSNRIRDTLLLSVDSPGHQESD